MAGQVYSSWPMGRQLKISFFLFSILVSLAIVLITRYQLIWLYNQLSSSYQSLLLSGMISQMKSLGREQTLFATQEFKNFIKNIEQLHDINSILLGFSNLPPPIVPSDPVQDSVYDETAWDYSTGCFFAPGNLSEAGLELEKKQAGMDKIYPMMNTDLYLGLYSGFEIDEIVHYYPGSLTITRTYTPLVREWYYTAKDKAPLTVITEPYQDSNTKFWVVTVAKAIHDLEGKFFGVAAGDVTLKDITSRTNNVKIMENGFIMLITTGGMILTTPDTWNVPTSDTFLIFNEEITGFSLELWLNMKKSASESQFEINRNGTEYIFLKYDIQPFEDSNETTHYLLIFVDKAEVFDPISTLTNSNSGTMDFLFLMTLCIASLVFIGLFTFFHFLIRTLTRKLEKIKKLLGRIAHRGLCINVTKGINFNMIENERKGIERLVAAVKGKIISVRETEDRFSYYAWGETRPADLFYHSNWKRMHYPFNVYNSTAMKWRSSFSDLILMKKRE